MPNITKEVYEQTCEDFRSLNKIMWQVPVLAMTLTGGAWYGVAKAEENTWIQISLLLIATVGNIVFIFVLSRLRAGVMEKLLNKISEYEGQKRNDPDRFRVIKAFSVVHAIAAVMSVVIAWDVWTNNDVGDRSEWQVEYYSSDSDVMIMKRGK